MIKNQWYAVLNSKELKINKPLSAKRLGEQLIFEKMTTKNKIILHQDRNIVLTQTPTKIEFKIEENLIQGDYQLLSLEKRRDFLKEKA